MSPGAVSVEAISSEPNVEVPVEVMADAPVAASSKGFEKPRVTVPQLRVLLEAIENDPSLYNAGNSDMISFLNIEKWTDLADTLNDFFDNAQIDVQNWKYILRYWSENTRKKMNLSKGKGKWNKPNPKITPEDAKELVELEKRLYDFMKKEESREIVDVTYVGKIGDEGPLGDLGTNGGSEVKFVVQLMNVFPAKPDENLRPYGPRKRTIVMKDDTIPTDPTELAKKFKMIFEQNVGAESSNTQVLGTQLDRLQVVSRDLEEHIATIQSRIHMIKDLWKHRCGDN